MRAVERGENLSSYSRLIYEISGRAHELAICYAQIAAGGPSQTSTGYTDRLADKATILADLVHEFMALRKEGL